MTSPECLWDRTSNQASRGGGQKMEKLMSLIGSLSLGNRHLRFAACVGGAAVLMAAAPAHAPITGCETLSLTFSGWDIDDFATMPCGEVLATMGLNDGNLRADYAQDAPGIGVR